MNRSAFKQGFYEIMDSRFTTAALIAVNGMFCWWLGYAYAKRERD